MQLKPSGFFLFFFNCLVDACRLEYSCTLLRVTEPLEDRMEQALFSPPLSKQRVEFAVKYIKESHACSLVHRNFSHSVLVYGLSFDLFRSCLRLTSDVARGVCWILY